MEYAVALTCGQARSAGSGSFPAFDRVYFGSEFCQNLIPKESEIVSARKKFGKPLTLLLPPVTDRFLPCAAALAVRTAAGGFVDEIVVNDFGLARILSKKVPQKKARLSLGRVLTVMLGHSVFSEALASVLDARLESIEADSLARLSMCAGAKPPPANFHSPLAYLSMTRYCYFKKGFNGPCASPCREKLRAVSYRGKPGGFYLRGNACLCDNRSEIKRMGGAAGLAVAFPAVKRLVLHPLPSYVALMSRSADMDRILQKQFSRV